MVVNRVKVTFLNEPGEGSGVARGFYTALAEAVLANQKLPNLEMAQAAAAGSSANLAAAASKSMQFSLIQRLRGTREARMGGRTSSTSTGTGPSNNSSGGGAASSSSKSSTSRSRDVSRSLSYDARNFIMNGNWINFFLSLCGP